MDRREALTHIVSVAGLGAVGKVFGTAEGRKTSIVVPKQPIDGLEIHCHWPLQLGGLSCPWVEVATSTPVLQDNGLPTYFIRKIKLCKIQIPSEDFDWKGLSKEWAKPRKSVVYSEGVQVNIFPTKLHIDSINRQIHWEGRIEYV